MNLFFRKVEKKYNDDHLFEKIEWYRGIKINIYVDEAYDRITLDDIVVKITVTSDKADGSYTITGSNSSEERIKEFIISIKREIDFYLGKDKFIDDLKIRLKNNL